MQWVWQKFGVTYFATASHFDTQKASIFIPLRECKSQACRSGTPMPTVAGARGQITIWDALYLKITFDRPWCHTLHLNIIPYCPRHLVDMDTLVSGTSPYHIRSFY